MKIVYLYLFLLISNCTYSQSVLPKYMLTAAQNNPGLGARFNEYLAALEKVPQVGALPDPTLAFGYFIQPVETKLGPQQAKISASQMFPWFGTLQARENAAESLAKSKYEGFEEAKSMLFYDVKSMYYNLWFTEKSIGIISENIEILASLKNLARIKVESGTTSAVDAYRVEMEINDLENQLALLRDNANVLKVKFNALLNVDVATEIQIDDLPYGDAWLSKQVVWDSILDNNHALMAFDHRLEELEYRKKSATKEGLPQISIGLEYAFIGEGNTTVDRSGEDAFMFPKVGITVPIYRKKYKARVKEIAYLQEAESLGKSSKENTLAVLFESVWKDYSDAARRLELYQQQTDLAKKSLSILESDYATHNIDFEEVLQMEQKVLKYGLEMYKALSDKAAAVAFMEYLQGK